MTKLVTNKFHVHNAREFIETFTEPQRNFYYFFYGKPTEFADDSVPPEIEDNTNGTLIDVYNNMIGAKLILEADTSLMVPRYNWTSNTVYEPYRHTSVDLFNEEFYVVVTEGGGSYSVFKCLDNASGIASTQPPAFADTSANDDFYFTSDGYQWKYMYQFDSATHNKFATTDYIPVVTDDDVSGNAVDGAIDVVIVESGGNNYNSYTNGVFQQISVGGNNVIFTIEAYSSSNADFYTGSAFKVVSGTGSGQLRTIVGYSVAGSVKRVVIDEPFTITPTTSSTYEITPAVTLTGDGEDFSARATVNATSNTIHSIEIINRGSGYTWATAVVTGNTGIVDVDSNTAIEADTATITPIISPPGGHGSDAPYELGGKFVGFSMNLDKTAGASKIEDSNDFRQIGIIKDALFSNVELTLTSVTSGFAVNDTVSQNNTYAEGVVTFANTTFLRLTDVRGVFESGNSTYGVVVNDSNTAVNSAITTATTPTLYVDQTTWLTIEQTSVEDFEDDEVITQTTSIGSPTAVHYFSNSTVMKLTSVRGVFSISDDGAADLQTVTGATSGAEAKVTGKILPDLVQSSGQSLYIENITPISRSNGQIETVRLILEF